MDETAAPDGGEATDPLQVLLEVQDDDVALDQLAFRLRTLPERERLAELDASVASRTRRRDSLLGELERLSRQQDEIETQVSSFRERVAAIEQRIRQGADYRDVQHMSDESASLASHQRELEDAELEVMEQIEPIESELGRLGLELDSLAQERKERISALSSAEQVVSEEAGRIRLRREERAARLPRELSATYERLRERLGGVGAARLVEGSCSGCHLKLPSSERERVLHGAPGQVEYCDQCGRILVG